MNRKIFPLAMALVATALVLSCLAPGLVRAADTLPLAGEWRFALDRTDLGTNAQWFNKELPEKIRLPGVLETQGFGDEIGIDTPWVLTLYDHFWHLRADYAAYTNAGKVKVPFLCQPPRHYLGAAWYQRDIEIPQDWRNRRITLFLERPHWKTTVWLDSKEIGSDLSLCVPHEFDFGLAPPGRHRLTVRVDNRMILPYRPDAHSVSDSLGSAWNGIAGKIELRSTPPVWIETVQVFPIMETKSALVRVRIRNVTGKAGSGSLFIPSQIAPCPNADDLNNNPAAVLRGPTAGFGRPITWTTNGATLDLTLPLQAPEKTWDEFSPDLHCLDLELTYSLSRNLSFVDRKNIVFGFRDFHTDGNRFIMNGRPVYFRGTHFGGDFPLTGYPPTDAESWKKIFQTCQDWGLNHMRFHSWCPPEAAFTAADELGFYLQIECGMWNAFTPGGEMEKMLYAETDRLIRAYGNHPSFVLLSASNEAGGRWKQVLPKWVEHFRVQDPRHLYTPDTGWSLIDEPGPVTGADFLAVGRVGPNRVRGESGWFGRDYSSSVKGVNVPVISHETGQWVAYPDFGVIKKFTGFMQPGNYEIFRDSARAHGLLDRNQPLAEASGKFQMLCYKEEIEANLRTPGLAGFQLLDLHDYTGQGTALVGLLDPFWESKGYVAPDEFKKFCNQTVPLARLPQRVFTTANLFIVPVEVAHFGADMLEVSTAAWQVVDRADQVVAGGRFAVTNIPPGQGFALGKVTVDLSKLPAPAQYKLVVGVGDDVKSLQLSEPGGGNLNKKSEPPHVGSCKFFTNDWTFWLYPAQVSGTASPDVSVTGSWNDAEKKLAAGGKVLFLPRSADLDWWSPPLARVPVFWNALMGPTWSRMLGLWCDVNHPALAEFPTAAHCDWQWTELLRNTRAVNLDRLPRPLQPIVQAIDDWNRNYKLGVIFECRVGTGKLMVCSIDLSANLDSRPGAMQLRNSLLDYMAGEKFQPQTEVSAADIRGLLFNTRIMRQLGATAAADGQDAGAILDGDPNTFWSSADARGNGPKHPHDFTVHFPQPAAMTGLVLMPRQNHREHQGDIAEFKLERSDNGTNWLEITRGQLASTWDPQTIRFPQTINAKHLKLTALSGFGSDPSASLAELAVMYAGPKIAATGPGDVEYQKVRTASPDIDAGTDVTNKPPKSSP
jgi:beta-galactosidase